MATIYDFGGEETLQAAVARRLRGLLAEVQMSKVEFAQRLVGGHEPKRNPPPRPDGGPGGGLLLPRMDSNHQPSGFVAANNLAAVPYAA